MITLDTSGLLAAIGQRDPNHFDAIQVLDADPGPYIIPVAAIAEMASMIETNFLPAVERAFLDDLLAGTYRFGSGDPDLRRIHHLTQKYDDLPLGFTDAAVISCGEQHGGRVLTFDRRYVSVVARGERQFTVLPPVE
ncbi:MAG: PIN domain-containing protein [Chloroflexota bacterium]